LSYTEGPFKVTHHTQIQLTKARQKDIREKSRSHTVTNNNTSVKLQAKSHN